MSLDEHRLAALRGAKLSALVLKLTGVSAGDQTASASSSSITGCIAGGRAFTLADSLGDLGPALHWYRRQDTVGLTVLAEPDVAPDIARRADALDADIEVRQVIGADVGDVEPRPAPAVPELPDELWRAAAVIADAGITVLDDHGRLTGDVNGLEVARVEPRSPDDPDAEITVSVGVGEADRQLHGYVHGHLDEVESLRRAAATVAEHRRPGAALHPLTRLARPRWLRSIVLADPSVIGLGDLRAEPPLAPGPGVFDTESAAAYSPADRVTVVCSAGVDLNLVPEAADYRLRVDPDSRLLLVVPPRDVKLATWGLVEMLDNAQVHALQPPWS